MNNNILLFGPLAVLVALVPLAVAASAAGTLHFKPESNATVAANHFISINGTSAASNATRTKCNVQMQTNGHGYQAVTPLGPNGTITKNGGLPDFTKWSATSGEMMKIGNNVLEGQIECFAASGNVTAPNFIHHLVHNVTGR